MTGIYSITNTVNGKVYVGLSTNIRKRWTQHKSNQKRKIEPNKVLYKSMNKYGINNFKFKILEECSLDIINEREIYWIKKLNSYTKGYNMTLGGEGTIGREPWNKGRPCSLETKRKISNSLIGKSSGNLGRKFSKEHKRKLSEAKKGKPSHRKRKIICVETGIIYNSLMECSVDMKLNRPLISKVLVGDRKTTGGYTFKYVENKRSI